ncbi:putative SAM dependent methyltransferase [Cavenderia fasciculata]|uniref:SAM dependent methyltransferase n=1 Tax=Cavenderia fasciculata TaxID=261658 RepID=F4QAE5_CACFS|nr:putative SAM dependent methyltransferase [Cavenderia fasciculata]EGG15664.1 putative SAM dependent methyltransferase [Cavenderia fasciculata]|eukprot:XP_004354406.1 putative SAM dependent methyltransferase [Cavenderia fasciculata]
MTTTIKLEQTSKGWDQSAEGYMDMMQKTGFTRSFAQDLLNDTIPLDGKIKQGVKVLDIATGAGAMSIITANRIKSVGGHVLATDFSSEMLKCLEKEIQKEGGINNITAQEMDGQNLTLSDNSFDFVYIVFGLMFFPDKIRGITEMFRVLKSGGTCGIATWSMTNPTAAVLIGTIAKLDPSRPPSGPSPVNSLADPVGIEQLFKQAGFVNIKVTPKEHSMECSLDEFLVFINGNPVFASAKESLPIANQHLFEQTIKEIALEIYPTGQLKLNSLAYLTTAQKP